MKKKIILMLAIMAMLVCVFAISVSAANWTYKDEAGQTYLTLTINDETGIITEYNGRFPMWTENNEPLTWYIIKTEGEQEGLEGCLSVPGKWGNVKRPMVVRVRAQDRNGNWFEVEDEELTARCFCHELEHLDGHLYTEHIDHFLSEEELRAYLEGEEE